MVESKQTDFSGYIAFILSFINNNLVKELERVRRYCSCQVIPFCARFPVIYWTKSCRVVKVALKGRVHLTKMTGQSATLKET